MTFSRRAGFFLQLILIVAMSSCSSWPITETGSAIDARFRLSRLEAESAASLQSPGVRTYQKWIGSILGSQCRYFPSDSRYHALVAKRCGPINATFKSMSRFFLEYDAPMLGHKVIANGANVYYEDIPDACSL